jgi:hypothetical protein
VSSPGFQAAPAEIITAAGTFSDQQQPMDRLGEQLRGVPAVDTGDPALDALIHDTLTALAGVLVRTGEDLTQSGKALSAAAETYQSLDADMAASYDSLRTGNGDAQPGYDSEPMV